VSTPATLPARSRSRSPNTTRDEGQGVNPGNVRLLLSQETPAVDARDEGRAGPRQLPHGTRSFADAFRSTQRGPGQNPGNVLAVHRQRPTGDDRATRAGAEPPATLRWPWSPTPRRCPARNKGRVSTPGNVRRWCRAAGRPCGSRNEGRGRTPATSRSVGVPWIVSPWFAQQGPGVNPGNVVNPAFDPGCGSASRAEGPGAEPWQSLSRTRSMRRSGRPA
jgi:hypothetical protein